MVPARRVMIAELDSVEQANLWRTYGAQEASRRLTAILRIATLLEGHVLLTHAQLLDGVFFLSVGPDELARLLGVEHGRLPFSVAVESPCASLADALALATSRGPGFVWSSDEFAEEGGTWEARRQQWVAAAAAGSVATTTFERRPLDLAQALDGPPPACLPGAWLGGDGAPLTAWTRSDLVNALRSARAKGEVSHRDAAAIYSWWNHAYSAALAASNAASWISFTSGADSPVPPRGRWPARALARLRSAVHALTNVHWMDRRSSGELKLDGSLLDEMTEMPVAVFATVRYRTRAAVDHWRRHPGALSLNGVGFAVRHVADASPIWSRVFLWSFVRSTAVLGLAAYVLLASLVGTAQAHLPLWSVLVAGFLACVPWQELAMLARARPGQLKAVIRVRR